MRTIKLFTLLLLSSIAWVTQAKVNNPVVFGNTRFTFITADLVRMEYALDGKFLDDSTLFAVNRTTSFQDVTTTAKDNRKFTIKTPKMRLEYTNDGFPIGQTNLNVYYEQNGKEKSWYIASTQSKNLKGAIATLDEIDKEVPLQEGLLSRDGWYAIHDTGKDILKNGWLAPRNRNHVQDIYLFTYGSNYKAALMALKEISGAAPMTRKYVHGSWYCRWWDYTTDDYLKIVDEYRKHDFPLDILVFDMGWHTQKEATSGTGHAGTRGWTGYSWNRKLIPNPEQLIRQLKDDQVHVVLNEHPHDGIRDHEDMYPQFMSAIGKEAKKGENALFDASDPSYMKAFMRYAHKESDDMGVAFWWLDWQQDYLYPIVRGTNTQHLNWLNHLYYDYSKQQNLRGAGFSRWAGWGDHRHPIQFSGDAVGNWDMLRFQIKLTATSGNAGCFFWAHDIGGFFDGKDSELYTRWTQFGLLNSSLRIHSVIDKNLDRRPWLWGERAEKAMKEVYHLRSRLMPYIYSSVRQCHTNMLPLNRGMYIEYPNNEEAYQNPQQFLFGDLILGAPITEKMNENNGSATQKIWLPEGNRWYNLFTGKSYAGGQTVTETHALETFPLLVKGGYPIPMQPYTPRMTSTALEQLIVRLYPAQEGQQTTYTLYEDDGMTTDHEKGKFATTRLTCHKQNGQTTLTIGAAEGAYDKQVTRRSYSVELPEQATLKSIRVNGRKMKPVQDKQLNGYRIVVPALSIREKVVIQYQ